MNWKSCALAAAASASARTAARTLERTLLLVRRLLSRRFLGCLRRWRRPRFRSCRERAVVLLDDLAELLRNLVRPRDEDLPFLCLAPPPQIVLDALRAVGDL